MQHVALLDSRTMAWFVDFAGEVAVDDPYKRGGEIGVGRRRKAQASISEAMTAQFSPPRSQCESA